MCEHESKIHLQCRRGVGLDDIGVYHIVSRDGFVSGWCGIFDIKKETASDSTISRIGTGTCIRNSTSTSTGTSTSTSTGTGTRTSTSTSTTGDGRNLASEYTMRIYLMELIVHPPAPQVHC